jgi:sugar/nucleoside kinase (ribokinase family)
VVIVTCGQRGCFSVTTADPTEAYRHQAFQINAVDTTGCGDVFHGAYAASLARGQPVDQRISFAAAAAALKARDSEIPRRVAVENFLRERSTSSARTKPRPVSPKRSPHT